MRYCTHCALYVDEVIVCGRCFDNLRKMAKAGKEQASSECREANLETQALFWQRRFERADESSAQFEADWKSACEERDRLRGEVSTLKTYTEMLIQQREAAVHKEHDALNQMRKCLAEAEQLRGRLAGLHHQYRTACADTEVDLALMDRASEALGKRAGEALDEAALRVVTERDEARWHAEGLRAALVVVESARDEARSDAASSLAMAKIADAKHDQKCAEVDMLRGVGCMEDGDGSCGACRKCAYRRGAEAMREAAMGVAWHSSAMAIHQRLKDLPIPEEPT